MAGYLLLLVELTFVAGVILALFELRGRWGLGLLYVFVGSNQYLQTVLASTLYVELDGGFAVSPGSAVLFASSLFAILLTYLREDIPQTRSMIYGIVFANVTLTLLAALTNWQIAVLPTRNLLGVPAALFQFNLRIFVVGTVTLLVDSFLIVVVYEFLFFRVRRMHKALRIVTALLVVLYFDALAFSVGSFGGHPEFGSMLASQLVAKTFSGLAYGLILYAYLALSPGRVGEAVIGARSREGRDVLSILTYRRRIEAVRRKLRVAEAASLAKSRFLTHASHELRTPLNAIIGFSGQLLKNKHRNLKVEDTAFVERIQRNGTHLLRIINGLLDLSKIESEQSDLDWSEVSLNGLVVETVEQLVGRALDGPVHVHTALPPQECRVRADRSQLQQVLINLVGNAVKFTPAGTVTVRLEGAGRGGAVLSVIDTGVGIPTERQEAIFEAFEQADPTAERAGEGTGLGLAISRAICDRMGFRLELESLPGRGSTFRIVMGAS